MLPHGWLSKLWSLLCPSVIRHLVFGGHNNKVDHNFNRQPHKKHSVSTMSAARSPGIRQRAHPAPAGRTSSSDGASAVSRLLQSLIHLLLVLLLLLLLILLLLILLLLILYSCWYCCWFCYHHLKAFPLNSPPSWSQLPGLQQFVPAGISGKGAMGLHIGPSTGLLLRTLSCK